MPRLRDGKIISFDMELWAQGDAAWDADHIDKAERLLRSAAKRGNAIAMDSFAHLLCLLNRPDEAVLWYERAVAAGNALAAWNLAMHYIPLSNQRLYRDWMLKAAHMGHDDAVLEAAKLAENPSYMTRLPLECRD